MFIPPIKQKVKDPRILGTGSSKMVWKIKPDDDFAVINAFDSQRFEGLPKHWTEKQMIDHSNSRIIKEYYFTLHVRKLFGDLIPDVFLFRDPSPFKDGKFRYAKQLCEPLVKDETLFFEMIRIADQLLDQGWIYLDMKPANLGIRDGKLCIIDTDPESFYKFQDELKQYFRICSYMIIILVMRNFKPYISAATYVKFILDRKLTYQECEHYYRCEPKLTAIAQYGNEHLDTSRIRLSSVMHPRDFLDAYGGRGALYELYQLFKICAAPDPYEAAYTNDVETEGIEAEAASRADSMSQAFSTDLTDRLAAKAGEAARAAVRARNEPARLARIEAARVEAARLEAARLEAARIEAERVEAARVESELAEAARIEAARAEEATHMLAKSFNSQNATPNYLNYVEVKSKSKSKKSKKKEKPRTKEKKRSKVSRFKRTAKNLYRWVPN